jgi:hypothetical protein
MTFLSVDLCLLKCILQAMAPLPVPALGEQEDHRRITGPVAAEVAARPQVASFTLIGEEACAIFMVMSSPLVF